MFTNGINVLRTSGGSMGLSSSSNLLMSSSFLWPRDVAVTRKVKLTLAKVWCDCYIGVVKCLARTMGYFVFIYHFTIINTLGLPKLAH